MRHTSCYVPIAIAALLLSAVLSPTEAQLSDLYINGFQYLQSSGTTNFGTVRCNGYGGQYWLNGNSMQCDTLELGYSGGGTFYQAGGAFTAVSVVLIGWERYGNNGGGRFSVDGGMASVGTITAGDDTRCDQSGGLLNVTNLNLNGAVIAAPPGYEWASYAQYSLTGGVVTASSEELSIGYFVQEGGTNTVIAPLVIAGDQDFGLGRRYGSFYYLDGGKLVATNISIGECSQLHCERGTNSWNIVSPGILSLAGSLNLGTNSQHLGSLTITQSVALFPPTIVQGPGSVLRFEDSSAQQWYTNAVLTVHFDASSGNFSRIFFGTNDLGLTAAQVAQIQFTNATTAPFWSTGAMILESGEVIPSPPPLLWNVSDHELVLRWLGPFTLQASTLPQGPYLPVVTTNSTYSTMFSSSPGFFRLMKQ